MVPDHTRGAQSATSGRRNAPGRFFLGCQPGAVKKLLNSSSRVSSLTPCEAAGSLCVSSAFVQWNVSLTRRLARETVSARNVEREARHNLPLTTYNNQKKFFSQKKDAKHVKKTMPQREFLNLSLTDPLLQNC